MFVFFSGCTGIRDVAVEVPFVATINDSAFSCSAAAGGFAPSDLRFYIHDLALIDARGGITPIRLSNDGHWQHDGVALIDFENASDNCADGTTGTHTTLSGHVAAGDYRALQFIVGVPFARNHADAAMADPPLNLGRMHWGWQGGYKFLRFEGAASHAAFRLHLGSTGCEGTIGNITRCSRPNRVSVRLDDFALGHSGVRLDLAALLPDLNQDATQHPGVSCMSERDDASCRSPFAALGIDTANGAASGAQTLFKVIALGGAAS